MNSYIQLLKVTPRDKIKITEISRMAEINRGTFYLHFADIREVEIAIEQEIINKIQIFANSQDYTSKKQIEMSYSYIENMLQDDTFVTLLSAHQSDSTLGSVTQDFYQNFVSSSLTKDNDLSEKEKILLYVFISGGIFSAYQYWVNNESDNLEQENLFIDKIVKSIMSITHKETRE